MNRALVATALTLASTAVFAAGTTANANATAKVKIRKAITLANTAALDFGGVVESGLVADTGSVSVSATGVRSTTGASISGTFNTTAAAAFNVGGSNNATYTITLPAAAITLTGSAGGTLSVDTFVSATGSGTATLSAAGTDTLTVGAKLTVPGNATEGDYTGSFPVTVAYN